MVEEEKKEEEKTTEEKKQEEEKKKKKERRGKKPHKNKKTSQKWKKYKIEGDTIVREKTCPRCGLGIFLMKAKNRLYCGKCHYTEFLTKEESNSENKDEKSE